MKKPVIVCLLLAALHAQGDLVVVEETVEPRQAPQTITIKTKGDKCRVDYSSGQLSAIYDLGTGDTIRIAHATKSFKKISGIQLNALKKGLEATGSNANSKPPKIVDTGKTEKMNGYEAEIYTSETPAATFTYWVTKDYPDGAAVSEEMKKLRERDVLGQAGNALPDLSQLDGIVLKCERLSSAGQAITLTLVSAKIQAVDDVEFQVPAGYTENPQQR